MIICLNTDNTHVCEFAIGSKALRLSFLLIICISVVEIDTVRYVKTMVTFVTNLSSN